MVINSVFLNIYLMWVNNAINHPPNPQITSLIGGINHSQMSGFLLFYPRYIVLLFVFRRHHLQLFFNIYTCTQIIHINYDLALKPI